jgi:hypothetical protein
MTKMQEGFSMPSASQMLPRREMVNASFPTGFTSLETIMNWPSFSTEIVLEGKTRKKEVFQSEGVGLFDRICGN